MKIFDAMNLICGVDCKWNTVQALATHDAAEAGRVIGLASGTQDTLQDRFHAN